MRNDRRQDTIWQLPQSQPVLKENEVHIWRANLDLSSVEIEHLGKFLSPDELERANRFHFPLHQKRFIAARGILRQLLGSYLKVSPNRLTFEYGDRGKPHLATDISLQFNLSHSEEYALFGFTLHDLIGVDLEYQRSMPDALKIARRFFSPNEYKLLEEVPIQQQPQLFFQLWTAKEAYLKGTGTGLSASLTSIEIALDRNQSLCLSALKENKIINWSLYSCTPAANYAAAIAINAQIPARHLSYWHWSQDLSKLDLSGDRQL